MNCGNILVTGSQGFVGQRLCRALLDTGYRVRAACRSLERAQANWSQDSNETETHNSAARQSASSDGSPCIQLYPTGDLTSFEAWSDLTQGIDAIIHLAARTHCVDENGTEAMGLYQATNVDVTTALAQAAVENGVDHFVYMSSVKAITNSSTEPLCEHVACTPQDSYGITKQEAERALQHTCADTSTAYTIVRPPLVYGPGVGGNFLRLMKLVRRGLPLPAIHNARSIVYVDNLISAVLCCLNSPAARDELFHVADPVPLSTTELVSVLHAGFQRAPRLLPFPHTLLAGLGNAIGKQQDVQRLLGSLTISTEKIESLLGWQAPHDSHEAIVRTVRAYLRAPWDQVQPGEQTTDWQPRRAA